MRVRLFIVLTIALFVFFACQNQESAEASKSENSKTDGVFVHITKGPENPHEVLMALQMAVLMSETQDVLVYLDIEAVHVVLNDSEDIVFSHFPSSHTQIKTLIAKGVTVMACPGCLKAAGKTAEDLMDGVQVANKNEFFNFTEGRILTLDY